MNVEITLSDPFDSILCPPCDQCHARMRLVGIEPHIVKRGVEVRTYQCLSCEGVQIIVDQTVH
jgi:hypothetical protein